MTAPILAVHGIWNLQSDLTPAAAADKLAARWTASLADGYRDAGLDRPAPPLAAAYYAHLLDDEAQGDSDLDYLSPQQQAWAEAWMAAAGLPVDQMQGPGTFPLRPGLDWLAGRWRGGSKAIGRQMAAFLTEVYAYMTRPTVREECRQIVADALDRSGARIVVAHSLGSVVAYEALHAFPDREVDLLVTLGSPLGLPGVIFEGLVPGPAGGQGARPPGVRRWVNIADQGDLVALPRRLGDRFPVDHHDETSIAAADFHTLGNYLACGLTAAAIDPYVPPTVNLRPARPADSAAVATIWTDGWRDGHLGNVPAELVAERTPESFAARAAARVTDTTVAVIGDEVAGFIMVTGDEVEQVYVDARHRGSGVAGTLLAEAERLVAAGGHEKAWLAVVPGNARARRFYERRGWSDEGGFDYRAAGVLVPCRRYVKAVNRLSGRLAEGTPSGSGSPPVTWC